MALENNMRAERLAWDKKVFVLCSSSLLIDCFLWVVSDIDNIGVEG